MTRSGSAPARVSMRTTSTPLFRTGPGCNGYARAGLGLGLGRRFEALTLLWWHTGDAGNAYLDGPGPNRLLVDAVAELGYHPLSYLVYRLPRPLRSLRKAGCNGP